MRASRRGLPAVALLAVLAAGCGEPPVALDVPARGDGQTVLDRAGILDEAALAPVLAAVAPGSDVVAVTYETAQASAGEAARAGQLVVREWGADIVLVAVAVPGDFTSTADDPTREGSRQRFFGIEPADRYAVAGGLREEVVEGTVPPVAATNEWQRVFVTAAEELRAGLVTDEETPS